MLGALVAANRFIREPYIEARTTKLKYTQSHIHSLLSPLLQYVPEDRPRVETQSNNFVKNSYVRVLVMDDSAYWIKDHSLFTADLVDGEVAKETTRKVDTMAMSKVELDRTMFIVEKLREGLDNADGGTGKP